MESSPGEPPKSPRLVPAHSPADRESSTRLGGSGGGSADDAGRIVDALTSSAEQELTIAERLAAKARQAFALAAGVFAVGQTVAFGGFSEGHISGNERVWIIRATVVAVAMLAAAGFATLMADATFDSGDLPLAQLEDDLNAAFDGDTEVVGRLGGYYLGVVRSRRLANRKRRWWYKLARPLVVLALSATAAELIVSLAARAS